MNEMTEDMRKKLLDILDEQKVAVLTTIGKDHLYSCLVSFEISRDLRYLFFATKRERQKYENLTSDSRVALIIDDHVLDDFNLHSTNVISISGIAEDYDGEDRESFIDLLEKKHPYLSKFLTTKDTALIRVSIEELYLVDNFERVQKFKEP